MDDKACDITVAIAILFTPILKPLTNNILRQTFEAEDISKKINGVMESPIALSADEKKLYKKENISQQNIILIYLSTSFNII